MLRVQIAKSVSIYLSDTNVSCIIVSLACNCKPHLSVNITWPQICWKTLEEFTSPLVVKITHACPYVQSISRISCYDSIFNVGTLFMLIRLMKILEWMSGQINTCQYYNLWSNVNFKYFAYHVTCEIANDISLDVLYHYIHYRIIVYSKNNIG